MQIAAIIIFVLTYILMLTFQKVKAFIAMGAAIIFVAIGIITIDKIPSAIDWNVLMMLLGIMGTVFLFIRSGMPALLADTIIDKMPDVRWVIVAMCIFSGLISAFIDNVATVLMLAPVAMDICKKLKVNPVPVIISISVSSNLQGAATLVGDTTSILLGGYANMDFLDFFFMQGKLGMFWVVQAGAVATVILLLFIFNKYREKPMLLEKSEVKDRFPTVMILATVILLIVASFIPNRPAPTNGVICLSLFAVGLIRDLLVKRDKKIFKSSLAEIDFMTLFLLAGLFIVIGGLKECGVIDMIGQGIANIGGDNLFLIYTIIVVASVVLSAFIDNIPYVATMLPVVSAIALEMGIDPYVLYFGLLMGATLGGNITPIGASANIVSIGILRKEGHEVSVKDFMKIGVPFTFVAVLVGYFLIWFIWA